ncbi:polymorphic toxin type 15 domain-containing protein [Chryseobacterium gambrini]|uniref:Novel toxin 15 domain-containing protein n=1 Tax=Chryseobacterium gambrini TaxID=373672 RepID=A0A1N7Q0F1_9FLAO|nr:polymorphic toxin type 15 domain-containing protein [Chryseobacterium gambrini]SIT16354.1 protein of unknown function [Chryseobacterium gambrini]
MAKKYVPEGAFLACDKGTSPSTLRVSFNKNTTIYAVPMATEADKLPFFHLKPMGLCTCPAKWATGVTCLPTTLQWDNPKDGVKINGNRMLLEDSTCNCIFGGKISIFFDRASAVAYGIGEGKMPSDYIKEGFDWLEQKTKENRAERDKMIPDWMKPIAGAKDWFDDLGTGLVEGAVNGVVGLGEVIYQVGQDPVGTAEALGGMVKEGYEATTKGLNEAYKWSTTPGNLEKAANSTWDWASKEENWDKLGDDIVKGAQETGEWIAKNPRKIGTTVGEFIPDAVAAVYTAGGSVAATAGKTALKEGAEVVVEKTVKEVAEAGAEKAGKEALEAGAKKGIKETLEQLAKKESDEIAAVVTRSLLPKFKLTNPFLKNIEHDLDEFIRQLKGQQEGLNKLSVDDFLKNRDEYLKNGRSAEGSAAQKRFRQEALQERIENNIESGMSPKKAKLEAEEWMSDKAALHDPDQIAGGFGDKVTGMGDKRVNSSLGSQWKTRIDDLDKNVRDAAEKMSEAERKSTYLNVELYP